MQSTNMEGGVISTQKDGKNDSPTKDKDNLFDPSVDMLVNDFDDERTLEEEEALAAGEAQDPVAELSNLQKESDMPLEELLALYGYRSEDQNGSSEEENELESQNPTENNMPSEAMDDKDSEPSLPEPPSKLSALYEPIPDNDDSEASRLTRSVSRVSDEEEEEYEYSSEDEELRKMNKKIMVGGDYQAVIPEGLCHYDDALPYENEDNLLWDPSVMYGEAVEDFLKKANAIAKPLLPMGTQVRDNEEALYMLQQCGHNVEEALRRLRMTVPNNNDTNESLWSEKECQSFEAGMRLYGKNFRQIKKYKVRTRSVGELVQFYYVWKKSERHDIFAHKGRLEKKKYALHPGVTDFMDRFLEDQDSRDRSSSPNSQCSGNGKPPPDT